MYFSHCFLIIEGRMGHVNPPNRQASLVILLLPYLHIVVVVIVVVGGLSENSLRQRRRGGNCWSRGIIIDGGRCGDNDNGDTCIVCRHLLVVLLVG